MGLSAEWIMPANWLVQFENMVEHSYNPPGLERRFTRSGWKSDDDNYQEKQGSAFLGVNEGVYVGSGLQYAQTRERKQNYED